MGVAGRLLRCRGARYVIVGGAGVALDLLIYSMLLRLGAGLVASKGVGILSSVVLGYFLNARWTFSQEPGLATMGRYCIVYAASIGVNVLVNREVVIGLHGTVLGLTAAFACATLASIAITWNGLKLWVFK